MAGSFCFVVRVKAKRLRYALVYPKFTISALVVR
jgi:hypothetical protein